MTSTNVPTVKLLRQSTTPITVRYGQASVSYLLGSPAKTGIAPGSGVAVTGTGPANDLRICLNRALNPLAESQAVVRRVAALAEVPL
ncbi:hypothetical protein AB0B94_30340 [Micromonospora sp. NPDC048986]|uniref:hypothetical protein n=1 Tax=Micromonospora sp. NPDC048986 TaxID=3155644 RepID=UPI0033D7888D